jgi:hypothetical protein
LALDSAALGARIAARGLGRFDTRGGRIGMRGYWSSGVSRLVAMGRASARRVHMVWVYVVMMVAALALKVWEER